MTPSSALSHLRPEMEPAARDGAVDLWGLGVIEDIPPDRVVEPGTRVEF